MTATPSQCSNLVAKGAKGTTSLTEFVKTPVEAARGLADGAGRGGRFRARIR